MSDIEEEVLLGGEDEQYDRDGDTVMRSRETRSSAKKKAGFCPSPRVIRELQGAEGVAHPRQRRLELRSGNAVESVGRPRDVIARRLRLPLLQRAAELEACLEGSREHLPRLPQGERARVEQVVAHRQLLDASEPGEVFEGGLEGRFAPRRGGRRNRPRASLI